MEPESKVLGATFDALDSVDSDQGPNRMRLTGLKWPQDFRLRHPPPIAGASEPNESNDSDEAHESKVLALGPTFDPLNSLASDQGPSRMPLINIKSWPWGPDVRCIRSIRFGPGSDSTASNQSKSPGLEGGDFRCISVH